MSLLQILPAIAGLFCVVYVVSLGWPRMRLGALGWIAPALLSAVFLLWTLYALSTESLYGFWIEHTRSLWGNQIWFDLLLAVSVAMTMLVPKARALRMNTLPWIAFVLLTGSIGLLAMYARVQFLAQQQERASKGLALTAA
jgi:ABC-type Na+ efflux pump permease subunit